MLNAAQVWNRVKKLKAFAGMSEFDFRPVYYKQDFSPAAGTTSPFDAQAFPNGAIVVGITASAYIPGVAADAQSSKNRQLFGVDFQFSNTDAITVNGPVLADALLGSGENDTFPVREIVIPPGSRITCRCANYTTGSLNIHVVYHALAFRTNA